MSAGAGLCETCPDMSQPPPFPERPDASGPATERKPVAHRRGPSRRTFLLAGAAAALAGAGGGAGAAILRPAARPAPLTPPPAALVDAIRAERALITTLARAQFDPALAARVRADHAAHEQALQQLAEQEFGLAVDEHALAPASGSVPTPRESTVPGGAADLDGTQVGAEEARASTAAAGHAVALGGRTATVLASIAACEATHAYILTGRVAEPPVSFAPAAATGAGTQEIAAWQDALAGEQRAVFGYSLLGPPLRADAGQLALAVRCSDAHEQLRDTVEELLAAAGQEPAAPAADYPDLYPPVAQGRARELAATLEEACTQRWRGLYALATTPGTRGAAQGALIAGAVRAVAWRMLVRPEAPTVAFPGM